MDTRSSRRHFQNDEMDSAELAGATTNSDGKRRTIGVLPTADCGCGQLHNTATENRADCDNARHRPATGTPTPTQSSATSWATSVQVGKLSARCPRPARKPIRNPRPVDNSILLCVNSPIGRCGHLLQEGGREAGYPVPLMFVESSSTITCKGSWTFVSHPLAGGIVIGQEGGCTSPDNRQVR